MTIMDATHELQSREELRVPARVLLQLGESEKFNTGVQDLCDILQRDSGWQLIRGAIIIHRAAGLLALQRGSEYDRGVLALLNQIDGPEAVRIALAEAHELIEMLPERPIEAEWTIDPPPILSSKTKTPTDDDAIALIITVTGADIIDL